MKVLVTDAESRKAFDLINILQRVYGYELLLFSGKEDLFQLKLVYGQQVFRLRSQQYADFETDLQAVISSCKKDQLIYIPVAEKPTLLFYRFIKEHPLRNLRYCLPEESIFKLSADKGMFQQYCERNGFPVPKSFPINADKKMLLSQLPLIAKPKSGAGSVGLKHIESKEQLSILDEIPADDYLLQEKIQSEQKVAGTFFVCKDGATLASYCHQRIRTFPAQWRCHGLFQNSIES